MNKKTCRDCLHCSIEGHCFGMPWHYPSGGSDITTLDKEACEHFLERDKPTVFRQITVSPEVLAKSLCGNVRVGCFSGYYSMLTDRYYPSMEEAVAATLAKLKEAYYE